MATGMALGLTWIFMGGPDILAMGADDMLKELAENASTSQSFSLGMFSSMKGKEAG